MLREVDAGAMDDCAFEIHLIGYEVVLNLDIRRRELLLDVHQMVVS